MAIGMAIMTAISVGGAILGGQKAKNKEKLQNKLNAESVKVEQDAAKGDNVKMNYDTAKISNPISSLSVKANKKLESKKKEIDTHVDKQRYLIASKQEIIDNKKI